MSKGKILKVRPGHEANCSSSAYIGYILITFVGYAALLGVLLVTQVAMRARRFAGKPWLGKAKIGLWVIPHLVATAILLIVSSEVGAMDYGSSVCVGGLALVMLTGMGVGWAKIAAKPRAARKAAGILCPNCGRQVGSRSAWSCPECEFDLTVARLVLLAGSDAVGTCPNCGNAVASTADNCPSCRIDLAGARENLKGLAE